MEKAKVYLVGAGPGDPGLFTLKGKRLLADAEVVVYDRLVGDEILAMANPEAEMIYVGKAAGRHALPQEEINALLVQKVAEGKVVVRLKGGDPFLYGRGGEEALYIREHGYDYEVVPGITSAIAVPAYAGIPVTHRDATSSFAVITGHEKPGKSESSVNWKEIATGIGTLVFLMGVENLGFICESLIKHGRSPATPVALIREGTRPQQQVISGTLENIVDKVAEAGFKPPAVIVVGEVVELREDLQWVERLPLWGKKIVVTRARAQASALAEGITELGGRVIEFPSIVIKPEEDLHTLHRAFQSLDKYEWIIFTSVNAVDIFFNELIRQQMDIRDLKGISICAIGPATRDRLAAKGLKTEFIPDEYRAEGIIHELKSRVQSGQWILLPRARGARTVLPDSLHRLGAHVNEVYLYQAITASKVSQESLDEIMNGQIDYLTFTSSSTVTNFVKIIGEENAPKIARKAKIACIGPVTAETARKLGFVVHITAEEYTISGLINALVQDCKGDN